MINFNKILVADFETSSANPYTCQPVELAAIVLDSRTLQEEKESRFYSLIRPTDFATVEQQALDVNKKTIEQLEKAPSISEVWSDFVKFVDKFSKGKSTWDRPILCGHNIIGFDKIIFDRLCLEFGPVDKTNRPTLFSPYHIDTMQMMWFSFESLKEPYRYNLDYLRKFFGIDAGGKAHEALQDVLDTKAIAVRFLEWQRKKSKAAKFAGAFGNDEETPDTLVS
jgi:DNA polymerase III epsilon subunit-like protein